MKKNNSKAFLILAIFITVTAFLLGLNYLFKNGLGQGSSPKPVLVAPVKTTKIIYGKLRRKTVMYGKVVAGTDGTGNIILGFNSIIDNIYVFPGQKVEKGQLLAKVSPTGYSKIVLDEAKNELITAKKILFLTEQSYKVRISTQQDLLKAKNNYQNALTKYSILKKSMISKIFPEFNGVVSKIYYTPGNSAPARSPIMRIVSRKGFVVKCGIDVENLKYLRPGINADILISGNNKVLGGKIIRISGMADPVTHLVNVYIKPENYSPALIYHSFVKTVAYSESGRGLIVPSSSVIRENGKYFIYTIKNNLAKKIYVKPILKSDGFDLINGNVKNGETVVVTGNYELKQGMRVRIKQ